MRIELLAFCTRCHRKFEEIGEVIEFGKYYPEGEIMTVDGKREFRPATWEIKKALCKDCMVSVNSAKFDKNNPLGTI